MSESIDLTLERLDRLERSVAGLRTHLDKRLDGVESALGKMVNVLEAHDIRLEEIVDRLDRLMEQSLRARTDDADRLDSLNRRLAALEARDRP